MESQSINQALAQIENNLKKLDSARIQVEKVTESGNNLTNATHQLAIEVKSVVDLVVKETTAVIKKFSESIHELEEKIILSVSTGEKNLLTNVEKFSETTKLLETIATKAITETNSISKTNLEKQEISFSDISFRLFSDYSAKLLVLEKAFSSLNVKSHEDLISEIENFRHIAEGIESKSSESILEVKDLSNATIQKQEEIIAKTINTLVGYSNDLQQLINQISSMGLPDRLEKIDRALGRFQEQIYSIDTNINTLEKSINRNNKKAYSMIVISVFLIIGLLVGIYLK